MRTKEFTFKKTKRVKTVTEHPAISVDLTVQDAANLQALLGQATGPGSGTTIYQALRDFVDKNNGTPEFEPSTTYYLKAKKS